MKAWMFVILVTGSISVAAAQDIPHSEVPSLVLNAFKSKYSNATDAEWKLKDSLYHVEFDVNAKDHDLWIDKSGSIKKQKEDFPKSQLPAAVRQKIETEFKGYRIDDVDKVDEAGKVSFLVDLDGQADDREVLFTSDGVIQENKID